MKKDKNISNPYNQALTRVKRLFSKESQSELPSHKIHPPKEVRRAYDYLKLPRMLSAKQRLLQEEKKKSDWSKKHITCTQESYCSLSPKYLMHLLLELKSLEKTRRVKKLYLKEYLLAKKNFQSMGQEMNEWMTSYLAQKIKIIPEENPQEQEETPWEDYGHKEERQFLINRVIKYLLD